jgi:hypothetical protein
VMFNVRAGANHFGEQIADFTSVGCPPFWGVDRYDSRYVPGECLRTMGASLDTIDTNPLLKVVVMTSMGPAYLTGEAFHGIGQDRVTGLGFTLKGRPELDRWGVYEEGMRSTLKRLAASNKKVIFVIDTPELAFPLHTCADSRPFTLTSKKREPCAFARHEYDARSKRYKLMLAKLSTEFPEVSFVDLTSQFCDDQLCYGVIDGAFVYRDSDHLSVVGSIYVGNIIAPHVKNALSVPR